MRKKEQAAWRIWCASDIKSARLRQKSAEFKLRPMRSGRVPRVLFSMYYLVNL